MVRSDSAGCTAGFVDGCRSRNIGFAVVARRKTAVSAAVAVANTDNDRWVPALNQDGTPAQPIHQDERRRQGGHGMRGHRPGRPCPPGRKGPG